MGKEILGSLDINRIYQFDCVQGMKLIPDNCIDLTVTSPPYDNLRNYKGFAFDFKAVAEELYRVTKHGGIVVWVVSDAVIKGSETLTSFRQALYFNQIGFHMHDTMIYTKNSYPFPPSNRYYQQFEYMFVLSKGKPKNTNLLRCEAQGRKRTSTTRNPDGTTSKTKYETGHETRVRDNVWHYNVGYMRTTKDKFAYEHPAMFPEQLAEDHILSWTNEGDVILDCFMGSGTTAKMATVNNRKWIGFETAREYIEIANMRLDSLADLPQAPEPTE